jgi:hypothetical protein
MVETLRRMAWLLSKLTQVATLRKNKKRIYRHLHRTPVHLRINTGFYQFRWKLE